MILQALSSAYGAVAAWRRRWYASNPSRRRALERPVVSVGNLTVGGSGKTPVVEYIARLLLEAGERPAILTRGYKRESSRGNVTVVSDHTRLLAGFGESGDEPLMLARALAGVPVLVGADRYDSGRIAEEKLGATVHVLDDGFQHVALARDVDLLLADEHDLQDRVMPAGRLREPLGAASAADAVLVTAAARVRLPPSLSLRRVAPERAVEVGVSGGGTADTTDEDATTDVARALGVNRAFSVVRELGAPVESGSSRIARNRPVFAIAGIARPERFFDDLRASGWQVAGTLAFRDHHAFTLADLRRIRAQAAAARARIVVTTAKDAVRLERLDLGETPVVVVPLVVTIEPADAFREWLLDRIRRAR